MKNSKPIRLSHNISLNSPGYGGNSGLEVESTRSINQGDTSNNSLWTLNNHFGTHIDAPLHFVKDSKSITDFKDADYLFNEVELIELNSIENAHLITPNDLKDKVRNFDLDLLLIRTNFEKVRDQRIYWEENPGFHPDTGIWLRENFKNIRAIGFDLISLTSFQHRETGRVAHREFLDPSKNGNSILIIEDMKLSVLKKNPESVLISPLFVEKADGSPVTAWAF